VSRVRPFASAGPTSLFNSMCSRRGREKRSAMENDFEVKSVDSPAALCGGLAAKSNRRASTTREERH
jgi:hypothetical protein